MHKFDIKYTSIFIAYEDPSVKIMKRQNQLWKIISIAPQKQFSSKLKKHKYKNHPK